MREERFNVSYIIPVRDLKLKGGPGTVATTLTDMKSTEVQDKVRKVLDAEEAGFLYRLRSNLKTLMPHQKMTIVNYDNYDIAQQRQHTASTAPERPWGRLLKEPQIFLCHQNSSALSPMKEKLMGYSPP